VAFSALAVYCPFTIHNSQLPLTVFGLWRISIHSQFTIATIHSLSLVEVTEILRESILPQKIL